MRRNNRIIAKAFRHFFIASVLISLIEQVNSLTDCIIVSHFISEDALSAIGLSSPVKQVVYAVLNLIMVGSSTLAAIKIGERKYKTVNRYFTVGIISVVTIVSVAYLLLIPKMDSLCRLLTDEERLLPYLCEYMPVAMINCIISAAASVVMTFTKIDGAPRSVTMCVILEGVANVIFDYILIGVVGMGIAGAAWATILSVMVSIAYLILRMKRKHSILHLEFHEIRKWYFTMFKNVIPVGIPIFVGTVSMAALRFFFNNVIQETEGADGMFVMTVFMQLMMLCAMFSTGAGGAACGIGGMLLGEKDNDGFCALVQNCLNWSCGLTVVVTAVLMIWPGFWSMVFGASAEMQAYSALPLRIMFMTFPPMCFTEIMSGVYNLQKFHKFVTVIMLTQLLLPLSLAIAAKYLAPHLIWYAFPVGSWVRLLMTVVVSYCISQKSRLLRFYTLVPICPENPGVDVRSRYDVSDFAKVIKDIWNFMDICVSNQVLRNRVLICVEEVANNIIYRSRNMNRDIEDVFSIRVIDENDRISVIIKEEGRPFNPIMKFEPSCEANVDEDMAPLMLLNGMCDNITYNYSNGINCIYLAFPLKLEERR